MKLIYCPAMRLIAKVLILVAVFAGLPQAQADLIKKINRIIKQPSQKDVRFSIHIVKADTGTTLFGYNQNQAIIPASNMKIITSAAALKYLSAGYECKTRIGLCGENLIVVGGGDPLLGDSATDKKYNRNTGWVFENIAAALKTNGKTTIKDIVIDTSIFDDQRIHPNWPKKELNQWYASEVCGMNYNDNCIDVTAEAIGDRVAITIEPQTNYVKIINKAAVIPKGQTTIGALRAQDPNAANKVIIQGKCRGKMEPFSVAIENPAAFFGTVLAERLSAAGIQVQGQVVIKQAGEDCPVQTITQFSTSIADCMARCNKNSLQLAADAMFKTVAAVSSPVKKNGSWQTGREKIADYLLGLGIDRAEFNLDDASGLSRENKLSANAITTVLLDIYRGKDWQFYRDSLSIGGIDGTLSRYFKDEKYKGRIFGKTGYISGVKSLSGVCCAADGDYIFSLLANNVKGQTRDVLNDIAEAIIDEAEGQRPAVDIKK